MTAPPDAVPTAAACPPPASPSVTGGVSSPCKTGTAGHGTRDPKRRTVVLCLAGLLLLTAPIPFVLSRPSVPAPSPTRIPLDVPGWMGKTPEEFRSAFGTPREAKKCVPGYFLAAPTGGESRSYTRDWGDFDTIFQSGRASGLLVSFEQSKPKGVDEVLRALNLPTGQPPDDRRVPHIRVWNNLAGYYVGITAESPDRVNEIVQANVRRAPRDPTAGAPVPQGPRPHCTSLPG